MLSCSFCCKLDIAHVAHQYAGLRNKRNVRVVGHTIRLVTPLRNKHSQVGDSHKLNLPLDIRC